MSDSGTVIRSASTWQQPVPAQVPGSQRARLVESLAAACEASARRRVAVAIDGATGAGKTSLGHELAAELSQRGRVVLRASLDDFKRPWADRHLLDRESGEGYYRNAFDLGAVRSLLLDPFRSPSPDVRVALCSIDPITQVSHADQTVRVPAEAVLLVDGVFALRPELVDAWDVRVWVGVSPETALRRGLSRDDGAAWADDAEAVHRDRYAVAERIYRAEVHPEWLADLIVDNEDLSAPRLTRRPRSSPAQPD